MKNIKKLTAIAAALCVLLSACGTAGTEQSSEKMTNAATSGTAAETAETSEKADEPEVSGETLHLDYGDAASLAAALNAGEDVTGKTVRFTVEEIHPDSAVGFNLWAGEHLNFVTPDEQDVHEGDVLTVKVIGAETLLDSWIISYEFAENAVEDKNTITAEDIPETSEEPEEPEQTEEQITEDTYEHNAYYDIVETSSWVNSIGSTVIVHKVMAKQDVTVSSTVLAYSEDGSVIGKSTDNITLTAGQPNYFNYHFSEDISNAELKTNAQAEKDSILTGERNAVELVQCDIADKEVFLTFKQTAEKLSSFAKFKLLLYSGDNIVGTEDGFFSIYAGNLSGKDTTDVADLRIYGTDFDRLEYIFEP
ncbi:hypothetical protein [Ruminococcus sp.]|uniref:hypothetical protein n=1 Tax=Ruminococcus sp. TaxID=41978 RepID=UPI0025D8568B|nr:hypothetical protein [Ruminococcus sp.]MBQ8967251.1 hypothetical protein [Ruminococcus sp.]